jgi:hypothetical protein
MFAFSIVSAVTMPPSDPPLTRMLFGTPKLASNTFTMFCMSFLVLNSDQPRWW